MKPQFVPRMEGLDALRGLALMGLFLVHMLELYELYWLHPATDPEQLRWHHVVFGLFSGKAFALLALCFGVSFFIIMDRAAARGVNFAGRFTWRMALLGALGFLHGLLYRGDILQVLALMGILVLPFYYLKSTRTLVFVGIFFLLRPVAVIEVLAAVGGASWVHAWPTPSVALASSDLAGKGLLELLRMNLLETQGFRWSWLFESGRLSQIFGLSLIGLALGRINFFGNLKAFARARLVGLATACALTVIIHLAYTPLLDFVPSADPSAYPRTLWVSMLSGWQNLCYTAILLLTFLMCYDSPAHRLVNLFVPVGRMTLTLYVGQSIVFIPYFYGFGLNQHASIEQSTAAIIGLAAFGVQVGFAHLWFRRFLYGPLEWVWRAGTYLTTGLPLRKRSLLDSQAR